VLNASKRSYSDVSGILPNYSAEKLNKFEDLKDNKNMSIGYFINIP